MIKDYTREELIEICEKAFVPEEKWHDRDSSFAQEQLGKCYIFLKDGCDFKLRADDSTENTIVLDIYTKGFCWFESFTPLNKRTIDDKEEHSYFYLSTLKRLEETNGNDWY